MVVRKSGGCQDTNNNSADFEAITAYAPRNTLSTLAPCAAPEADMIVAIAESQDPIATNGTVTYTVTATNDGTAAAANVDLSIVLSGTANPGSISGLTQPGSECVFDDPTDTITCTDVTSVAVDGTFVVSFDVTPTATGDIVVDATVAADAPETGGNNTAQATTAVQIAQADITVTTGWTPATVYTHDAPTVTFTVNNGPLAAADNVTLTATFSGAAFEDLGTTPTVGCTVTPPDTLNCEVGTIIASGNAIASVAVNLTGVAGDVVVDVDVATTSTESDASNNSDSDTITVLAGCGVDFDNVYDYQEGGVNGAVRNVPVIFEGIVTADFQEKRPASTDGYYIQQVPGDGNTTTSDGIFVFHDTTNVSEGDKVRVYGTVSEFNGLTQLGSVTNVINCGTGLTVTPATVQLPLANLADWENYEGMLVTITDASDNTLTVADQFNLDNFGEMIVATQTLYQPTHLHAPASAGEDAATDLNNRSKIIVDDGSGISGPNPIPHYEGNPATHIRMGDSIAPITGVVSYGFNAYRVHYTEPLVFTQVNTRPADVPAVGGRLKVGSFNVLNYFNGNGLGGGFPTSRGASNLAEFNLQTTKLVAAILKLDADILGLMEIENDGGVNQAAASLVNALNAASAPGTYAYIDTGVTGTDEIKVAVIYQPASVTPQGPFAVDNDPINNRPTLAQTFTEVSTGEDLTVVVNHFKSKGSCPSAGDPNADNGDGQSCWAPLRVQQAQRLLAWLGDDPTDQADPDILILGDLNSYAQESPITTLKTAGYVNLIEDRLGSEAHSYYFSGQAGYLDHALASAALEPQVTGIADWHINANEPDLRDYNDFANTLPYKETNEFRTSDHDPVLVGVSLQLPLPTGATGSIESTATITTGDDVTVTVIDADLIGSGTVLVTATGSSGDSETLTLTETGTAGTFSGTFTVADAAPITGNSSLEESNGTLTFSYVDALDAEGDVNTTLSDTTAVQMAPPPPEAFELLDPQDGAILRATAATFTWTESAGAISYDVLLVYLSTNTRIGEQYTANIDATACAAGVCSVSSSVLIPAGFQQGSYSWTVVANAGGEIEASDGPNLFTVDLDGIELVANGGLEDGSAGWVFTPGAKRKCAGFGDGSNCAFKLKPKTNAQQRGVMGPIFAATDTVSGDVLQVSAAVSTAKTNRQRVVMVVIAYVDPTAGAASNGKDKFKLFVEQATTGYETFSENFVLDGAAKGGRIVVANTLTAGNLRVDDVSVVLMPVGSTPRAEAPASADGVLPVPSAPDNFRGNN